MDEQTLEKNDVLQELLKSEYDLAKHECEYYTQEFNKQDTVYGVYFAVFSVVIGAIYKIAETNNDQLELTNLAVILILSCGKSLTALPLETLYTSTW